MKTEKEHTQKLIMLLEDYTSKAEYIDLVDRKIHTEEPFDLTALRYNTVDEWLVTEVILPSIKSAIINQELPNF